MNYFKINLSTIYAGLTHQRGNFIKIIKYCYCNDLKLVKPIFTLTGYHNHGHKLETDLSEYFDLENITVDGNPFKLYDDSDNIDYTVGRKIYENSLLSNYHLFQNTSGNVIIPYRSEIIKLAEKVSQKIGNYMCIHVRRGDRITNRQIDIDTQPDNIKKIITKYRPTSVYIMTNKVEEIRELHDDNVFFYDDFDFLREIEDNYYLYCVESNIMKLANVRCSTFNTNLVMKNNTYYHCYLTDHPGWQ